MVKDLSDSFKGIFGKKSRNPFILTYILVWLIRNWFVLYRMFNFDEETTLDEKMAYFNTHFSKSNFITELFINMTFALSLLILAYMLLSLTRGITNLFEFRVIPWVYKITDSTSVVTVEMHNELKESHRRMRKELNEEKDNSEKLSKKLKDADERNAILQELNLNFKSQIKNHLDVDNIDANLSNDEKIIYNKLRNENLSEYFVDLFSLILKGSNDNFIKKSDYTDTVQQFQKLGLIEVNVRDENDFHPIVFTEKGLKILDVCRLELAL